MKAREIANFMEENGFRLTRTGKHHIWRDGYGNQYTTTGSSKMPTTSARNMMSDIKRIVKNRVNPGDPVNWLPIKKEEEVQALTSKPFQHLAESPHRKIIVVQEPKKPVPVIEPVQRQEKTVEEPSVSNGSRAKYDAPTRARVWGRMVELYNQGKTNAEITQVMQDEGYKSPDRVTPIRSAYVSYVIHDLIVGGQIRSRALPAPQVVPAPAVVKPQPVAALTSTKLPDAVMSILTDPQLTAEKKIRMIMAYAED